jgi:hypothetical protein
VLRVVAAAEGMVALQEIIEATGLHRNVAVAALMRLRGLGWVRQSSRDTVSGDHLRANFQVAPGRRDELRATSDE